MTKAKRTTQQSVTTPKLSANMGRRLKWYDVLFASAAILLIVIGLWNNFANKHSAADICSKEGILHTVFMQSDSFTPDHLVLHQCDKLRVSNTGDIGYILAFGVHEQHVEYPGFTEQALQPNQYLEVTTLKTGSFIMHDHIRDKAVLTLDIKP